VGATKLVIDTLEPRRLPGATDKDHEMSIQRLVFSLVVAGSAICAVAPTASADASGTQSAISANWSGYVVGSKAGDLFSSVSGSWVEPSANCSAGQGDASFWVGLGGSGQQSQAALEQVGTAANCSGAGNADHYAWYELVPAAPVRLDPSISPGDHMSGKVTVSGSAVTVSLVDQTTGASATKTLTMNNPDVSSAEWIAEAPSTCDGSGSCQPVALADFGTVSFSNASATAGGHTGTISDPSWMTQPVALSAGAGGGSPDFVTGQSSGSAQASGLSTDGSSFSVGYVAAADQTSGSSTGGNPTGGYDPTAGYGLSGYGPTGGGSAYGYGSGDGYGYGAGAGLGLAY
jgi:hypothetical protein